MNLTQTVIEKFHQKPSEAAFSAGFFRDNFRSVVASDVISGGYMEAGILNVRVKLGDSRSNRYRDIRLPNFVKDDDERQRTQVVT